jgi:hypothetical protein
MKRGMKTKCALTVTLTLFNIQAYAGEPRTGTGATPAEACWQRDYQANEWARSKTTCYTSCKLTDVHPMPGGGFISTTDVPNRRGSCRKSKYDRSYKGQDEFLVNHPKPGATPPPPSTPSPAQTDVLYTTCDGAVEVLEGSHDKFLKVRAVRFIDFQWTFSENGKLNHYGIQNMAPGNVVQAEHARFKVGIAC